jgi:hypothetical protein
VGDLLTAVGDDDDDPQGQGRRALAACLGDSKGHALWEMAHGRDPVPPSGRSRGGEEVLFERQAARKSVSSQASWGVRFDSSAQVGPNERGARRASF